MIFKEVENTELLYNFRVIISVSANFLEVVTSSLLQYLLLFAWEPLKMDHVNSKNFKYDFKIWSLFLFLSPSDSMYNDYT